MWFFVALLTNTVFAKINVVTSIPDLQVIAQEVGGDEVRVESFSKGTQDPHFIEARPSFMMLASRADLVISIGLDLEIGWLPNIVSGSRNPKIAPGQKGNLEVGPLVRPLEIPTTPVSRADGDVHAFGNPHVTLDPERAAEIAAHIAKRLGDISPSHAQGFLRNAGGLSDRLKTKLKIWQKQIDASGIKKVVTYHKTLTYFLSRFGIENPAILEPKPGIPPTSGHILKIIQLIKAQSIALVLVENYFDPAVTKRIEQEVPGLRVESVPVLVGGEPGIIKIDDLYERIVASVVGKPR